MEKLEELIKKLEEIKAKFDKQDGDYLTLGICEGLDAAIREAKKIVGIK